MDKLKSWFCYVITAIGIVLIAVTALSLFYNRSSIWWVKSLNFPRLQALAVIVLCLLAALFFIKKKSVWYWLLLSGLTGSAAVHTSFIISYTPLTSSEVATIDKDDTDSTKLISLLVANVHMTNRNAKIFINAVLEKVPDMVLVMETNRWWQQMLQPLNAKYSHQVAYPMDNTYGMVLYSRYPLLQPEIRFLQHDSVPSIHVQVLLTDGRRFSFHGVHPVPPTPSAYPDNIGEEAGELERVAELVAKDTLPVVVAGDLNDVAWSNTSRLFKKKSKLKDVRVGRGFYSSFDARSCVMRWPLDHVFVSESFKLVYIEKWPAFGSDHFPVYVQIALNPKSL